MIDDKRAKELLEAHLASSDCNVCKEATEQGLEITKCGHCGWDMMEAELASENPDIDVVITKFIRHLKDSGWTGKQSARRDKVGAMTSMRPPIGRIAETSQVIIGQVSSQGFVIAYSPKGFITGNLFESSKDSIATIFEEVVTKSTNLQDHEIDMEIVNMTNKVMRKE